MKTLEKIIFIILLLIGFIIILSPIILPIYISVKLNNYFYLFLILLAPYCFKFFKLLVDKAKEKLK